MIFKNVYGLIRVRTVASDGKEDVSHRNTLPLLTGTTKIECAKYISSAVLIEFMSFFDNNKNVGTLLIIIGVISVICGIIVLFVNFDDGVKIAEDVKGSDILSCIGAVIPGLIFMLLGSDIRNGSCKIQLGEFLSDVQSKFGILVAVIFTDAIGLIITSVIEVINDVVFKSLDMANVSSIVLGIVMIILAYLMIKGGSISGKIIWIILAIVFVIGIIGSAITCLVLVGIPFLLLYLMLFAFLLSPEVKQKMSM